MQKLYAVMALFMAICFHSSIVASALPPKRLVKKPVKNFVRTLELSFEERSLRLDSLRQKEPDIRGNDYAITKMIREVQHIQRKNEADLCKVRERANQKRAKKYRYSGLINELTRFNTYAHYLEDRIQAGML